MGHIDVLLEVLALAVQFTPFAVQLFEVAAVEFGIVVPVAATSMFWPPLDIARAFTGFGVYAVKLR
jgi:hypothetical protein